MENVIPYDRTGSKNPKWRGGRVKTADGRTLVYMPNHPNAKCYGGTHILEYRLIAEQITGRPLLDSEIVHHKNGDVADNRLDNLEVMAQSKHVQIHLAGERSPNHKLTEEQVKLIRVSSLSTTKLGSLLGVSFAAVWRARKGITWKSVTTPNVGRRHYEHLSKAHRVPEGGPVSP